MSSTELNGSHVLHLLNGMNVSSQLDGLHGLDGLHVLDGLDRLDGLKGI